MEIKKSILVIIAIVGMLLYFIPHFAYAVLLQYWGKELDVMYAMCNHFSFTAIAIVCYFSVKHPIVKAISVYIFIYSTVVNCSFFVSGLIYDKNYFLNKAALISSIFIAGGWYLFKWLFGFVKTRLLKFKHK